ncbi:MAG: TonB-dependent receptor [Tenuifilaceae bacterium]|jgi:TonB-linked SusC/RagA family outer membrane protein|nr:TonB-dependent receptor [Tenuifilaceae bacterium]
MKKLCVFLVSVVFVGINLLQAQTVQITGTVTSAEDGMPIPGASVLVKGTSIGVASNVDGQYTISAPATATTLVFSFVGMVSQEVAIAGRTVINVVLASDAKELEEVIVIAYGVTKKESFTGSADVISAEKLEKRTVTNVTKGVEGLAPGVQVSSGTGQPGEGSAIRIRGIGSINASTAPLYVVDGVPFDGAISAINPADIESMTILKDASAGALYGSRGANGVVMITTKKGSKQGEDMKVNFRGVYGVSQRAIPAYETMNQKEWFEYQFQAYKNQAIYNSGVDPAVAGNVALTNLVVGSGSLVGGASEIYNPYNYSIAELIDPVTGKVRNDATLKWTDNWMDEILAVNPVRKDMVVSLTGGTETAKYMASIGYLDEQGLLKTTAFDRFSGRVNVDATPKEWVKFGLNLSLATTSSNFLNATGSAYSNVWYSAMLMGPIYPVYIRDADGNLVLDAEGKKQFDYGASRPSGAQGNYNSIATLYDDKFSVKNDNVSARTYLNFLDLKEGVLQGLAIKLQFGTDYITQNQHNYENPYFGNAAGSNGRAFKYNTRTLSYTFTKLLTYTRTFADKHQVDLLAGHENYAYRYNWMYAGKTGFPFGGLYELNGAATVYAAGSYVNEYFLESYLSRLNYSFDDRYYISGSYRTDGSSRFYKDSRWGQFWSIGANWRVSQEEFMADLTWINNMSVKASYGAQGNDAVSSSLYAWQSLYSLGYPNAGVNGGVIGSLENRDLMWETNKNFNVGVDARLFNRLSVAVEWYNRVTEDMLMNYPIALSLGFTGYDKNIGSMVNSGLEFSLSGEVIQTQDFRWTLGFMGSTIKNKVLKLADKPEITLGNQIIKEGETVYSHYLPRSAGVDPATGQQLYWAWDLDADGNKGEPYKTWETAKALQSREIVGDRMPTLYGSISNEIAYKGIDLSILSTYSIGGLVYDGVYHGLLYPMYQGAAIHSHNTRAWTEPGQLTDIPMPIVATTKSGVPTDADLIDASYFSIKNITLGYTLPKKLVSNLNISSVRIAAVADNLVIFTHLKGMNPQFNFTGGTDYVYTPTRTFSLSLDLTF